MGALGIVVVAPSLDLLAGMIGGQHHRVGARHLGAYAVHAAWLEDHRDQSNGALSDRLIRRTLPAPVSRT